MPYSSIKLFSGVWIAYEHGFESFQPTREGGHTGFVGVV